MAHTFRGYVSHFDHCAPLLLVLAPFTHFFREPSYLVVIIAVAAAASVWLVYQMAASRAPKWGALALATAYALTPALHGATLYENPLRAMAAPLVLASFTFFFRGRFTPGLVFAALAATASEEMAVYVVAVGVVGTVITRKWRFGIIATAALALYAGVVCFYLYPKFFWNLPTVTNALVYFDAFKERGISGVFTPHGIIPLANRLWFLVGTAGGVAAFVPFAGYVLLALFLPVFTVVNHGAPSTYLMGYGAPFLLAPFAYAAAAWGMVVYLPFAARA